MAVPLTNATDLRSPGRRDGAGMLGGARKQFANLGERSTSFANRNVDSLASGLGWFSVGLGLAQIAVPHRVAEIAGIEPTPDNVRLMRSFGMRELTSGVGILTQPAPDKWLWSRVLGDVLDLAMLGVALGHDKNDRGRTVAATLAVLGVTGLDLLATSAMARKRDAAERNPDLAAREELGEKTVFRIITIKAHPANVERDWNEWVAQQGSEETREATVTFAAAPAGQGTEIRAELTYTPRAGKLGTVVQKMRHKSPGQLLGHDLKLFKMICETGEITKSDASIHKHMHPAQPDDSLGNANLIREDAQ